MLALPNQPSSLIHLFKCVFAFYPKVFKSVGWLIVLSATAHLICPWFFIINQTIGFVVLIGCVLVTWYIFGAILWRADAMLRGGIISFSEAFRISRERYLAILFGNVIFFAIIVLLLLVEFALWSVLEFVHLNNVSLMISALVDIVVFTIIYFAIPLIILDGRSVTSAFNESVKLVWNHWLSTFVMLFFVFLVLVGLFSLGILITGWNRMYLFTIYDFCYQVVAYPLIISATLLMLNDLKLRQQEKKKNLQQPH